MRLSAGLCPDPLEELTALPMQTSIAASKGSGRAEKCRVKEDGEGRSEGRREGGREGGN